jgi:hypothetical protein
MEIKKYLGLMLLISFAITFSACAPSEVAIQTAIAQTEEARPTETPKPTNTTTSTPLPSPTFTEIPTRTPELPPLEERVIGEWSGFMTNVNNDKIPATWTFLDNGIMAVSAMGFSYGAEWYLEDNRIHIISELDPNNPTYRDIEFISGDLMILTKEEADIKETWTRVKDE